VFSFIRKYTLQKGFLKYLFNTSWLFAEQGVRIISGLFIGVWIAKHLGPENYGKLSYAIAFSGIFGSISALGLESILVRELINQPENHNVLLGTVFRLRIIGAFIILLIIASILFSLGNDPKINLYIFIISFGFIFQSFEVISFFFQSQVLSKIVSICKFSQLLLSSLLKGYLILINAEIIWFSVAILFDTLSLSFAYFIAYKLNSSIGFYQKFDWRIAKVMLKDSWPLIFSSFVVMIYMRIDQIMIKEILGEIQVGIYSSAMKLSESFYFIPMLLVSSIYPAIINSRNQSKVLYEKRLQNLYTIMTWSAIIISFIMTFLSDSLVLTLFGDEFFEAGNVLKIHIWSSIFVFMGVASGSWYLSENLQRISLINTCVGAFINIVLNLYLIPVYGVNGAAYATLVSYGFSAYIMNYFWSETRSNFLMLSKSLFFFKKNQ
jgi:O-antigen/teichoic acid export membrane protein